MLLISNFSNNTSPNPSEKIIVAPGHVFHTNNNLLAWIQIKKICILELKILPAQVRILRNMWTLLCRWRSSLLYPAHTLSHSELVQQTRTLGTKVKRNIKRQKPSLCCKAPSPPPSWIGCKRFGVFETTTIHSSSVPLTMLLPIVELL